MVTATYKAAAQIAQLVRLKQTLQLVPNSDWIVVHNLAKPNTRVLRYIRDYQSGKLFNLAIQTTADDRLNRKGLRQRNKALTLVRQLAENGTFSNDSVVYFADDANTYDVEFLDLIRQQTKNISVFNVGLLEGYLKSGPWFRNGTMVGFRSHIPKRKFGVDMAGFAVNLEFMRKKGFPRFNSNSRKGFQESDYLERYKVEPHQLQFLQGKEEVNIWATQTYFRWDMEENFFKLPPVELFIDLL